MSNKNYAYVRGSRLKTASQMTSAYMHNERLDYCENADPAKKCENRDLIQRDGTYAELVDKRIKELPRYNGLNAKPIRSDAVRALDIVISAPSIEKLQDNPFFSLRGFCDLSKNWAIETFGEENIIGMHLHMDERAPHIHLVVMPITKDGRLSAHDVFNGKRRLSELQTSYANAVKPIGLSRGEQYSVTYHVTLKEHYAAIGKTRSAELPMPYEHETLESYRFRANLEFKDSQSQHLDDCEKLRQKYEEEATKRRQAEAKVDPEALEKEIRSLKQKSKELEELRQKEKAIFEKKLSDAEIMNDAMLNIRCSFQKGLMPKDELDTLQRLMTKADRVGGEDRKADVRQK